MAFDGVVIANIVYDMNRLLTGGRIYKIYSREWKIICKQRIPFFKRR